MSFRLDIFSNNLDAIAVALPDGALAIAGIQGIAYNGRPCISFTFPSNTSNGHGCRIELRKEGYSDLDMKGILWLNNGTTAFPWKSNQQAALEMDDFIMQLLPVEPEPGPGPGIPQSEIEVIERAYETFPFHTQRVEMLKKAARDLNFYNFSSEGRGPFGILRKQTGNNCGGYSCDIIAAGQGNDQGQWDVLINDEIPAWNGPKTVDDGIRVDICEPQLP